MTHKRRIWMVGAVAAAGLVVLGMAILPDAVDRALKARFVGAEHVYELSEQPEHLSEELAILKARETLARDGFDTNVWKLVPDDRSSALGGRPDSYFLRNTKNPNEGTLTVQDSSGSRRYVHVELQGNRVKSCVVRPK